MPRLGSWNFLSSLNCCMVYQWASSLGYGIGGLPRSASHFPSESFYFRYQPSSDRAYKKWGRGHKQTGTGSPITRIGLVLGEIFFWTEEVLLQVYGLFPSTFCALHIFKKGGTWSYLTCFVYYLNFLFYLLPIAWSPKILGKKTSKKTYRIPRNEYHHRYQDVSYTKKPQKCDNAHTVEKNFGHCSANH